jgi:hypothetical protein
MLQNVLQGTMQFQYTLPPDRVLGDTATLTLAFTHSDAILFDKSVMTVTVNGTPVKSARLTEQTAKGGRLEVPIDPAAAGSARDVTIAVTFQFADPAVKQEMSRDFSCDDLLIDDWAVIDGSSSIHLPLVKRQAMDFAALPYPFAGEDAWNDTLMISPRWNKASLQAAMTIAGYLGSSGLNVASLKHASALSTDWKQDAEKAHLIYVGAADGLPAELNGFTGSFFRAGGKRIEALSEHIAMLDSQFENFALMQLTESPLASDRALLIAAAASEARLSDLTAAFADPQQSFMWTGRFVSVTPERTVVNYPGTKAPETVVIQEKPRASGRWSQFTPGETGFLAIAIVVVAALSAIYWNMRRRPRRK